VPQNQQSCSIRLCCPGGIPVTHLLSRLLARIYQVRGRFPERVLVRLESCRLYSLTVGSRFTVTAGEIRNKVCPRLRCRLAALTAKALNHELISVTEAVYRQELVHAT